MMEAPALLRQDGVEADPPGIGFGDVGDEGHRARLPGDEELHGGGHLHGVPQPGFGAGLNQQVDHAVDGPGHECGQPLLAGGSRGWVQLVTSRLPARTRTATMRNPAPSSRSIACAVRRQPWTPASGVSRARSSLRVFISVNQLRISGSVCNPGPVSPPRTP